MLDPPVRARWRCCLSMSPGPTSSESGDVPPADTCTRAHVYTAHIRGWPCRWQTLRALKLTQMAQWPYQPLAEQDKGPLVRIYRHTCTRWILPATGLRYWACHSFHAWSPGLRLSWDGPGKNLDKGGSCASPRSLGVLILGSCLPLRSLWLVEMGLWWLLWWAWEQPGKTGCYLGPPSCHWFSQLLGGRAEELLSRNPTLTTQVNLLLFGSLMLLNYNK